MALVEIARFADLREGQIAASRLRAAGLMPILWDEYRGSIDFLLWQALGGFRLSVIEDEAEEARALIEACRTSDPAALDWQSHPQALTSAPTSLFWAIADPTGAIAWGRLRKKFTVMAFVGLLLGLSVVAVFVAAIMTAAR